MIFLGNTTSHWIGKTTNLHMLNIYEDRLLSLHVKWGVHRVTKTGTIFDCNGIVLVSFSCTGTMRTNPGFLNKSFLLRQMPSGREDSCCEEAAGDWLGLFHTASADFWRSSFSTFWPHFSLTGLSFLMCSSSPNRFGVAVYKHR